MAASPKAAQTVRDPGTTFGPYRVLQRVDGPFLVVDERRPLGDRTVARYDGQRDAEADARQRYATLLAKTR